MVPDTAIIVKVLLYTSGFTNAPSLAVKLTKLYQMAEMQLSHQVIKPAYYLDSLMLQFIMNVV